MPYGPHCTTPCPQIRNPITDNAHEVKTSAVFTSRPLHTARNLRVTTTTPPVPFLSTAVAHKMIPLYRHMSDEALLRCMTHGGTQNIKECISTSIWVRYPKTSSMGMPRLQGSVAKAVSAFNEEATEMVSIMNKLYVDVSIITLELLTKKARRVEPG